MCLSFLDRYKSHPFSNSFRFVINSFKYIFVVMSQRFFDGVMFVHEKRTELRQLVNKIG